MSEKLSLLGIVGLSLVAGYFIGTLGDSPAPEPLLTSVVQPEVTLVQLQKIEDDLLHVDISGPARVLWEGGMVENDGSHTLPIGQIPREPDLTLRSFQYVGNAKTMKFYPSDSYPARGTAVEFRRFFQTKDDAIAEGFIPMKGMD